ncbi:MAG: MarC family protein [Spirochaetaceae bacterium]|jgi:multiple antibiotic resistance protein|nr:MarC family protein [Spirochaetaceae bacterium]
MAADFLRILFTVLLVMDPIGMVPQFLAITSRYDDAARRRIIVKALLAAGFVLLVFLLAGKILLDFFGIMPGAFYISGGILFFLIAFEMIYSRPGTRSVPSDEAHASGPLENSGVSVAVFPLAIPLIAGPGILTVIIMFITGGKSWLYSFSLLFPAILISLAVTFVILRCSSLLLSFLGAMGIFIMEKIMGLILAGFAVQFIYNGLTELGIIGR